MRPRSAAARHTLIALVAACVALAAGALPASAAPPQPPAVALSSPVAGASYDAAGWAAACGGAGGVCGSAADPTGVTEVLVSIRQDASGRWWNGASFSAPVETFLAATGTTSWRYALPMPGLGGQYTVHARAVNTGGVATPAGREARATFRIVPPPVAPPQLTATPGSGDSIPAGDLYAIDENGSEISSGGLLPSRRPLRVLL